MLAGKHPACFFENPRQRQPLKKGIIDDLRAQQRPWDERVMSEVLRLYTGHWGYLYAMIAGAWRVDLEGTRVERVTEQEAQEAYNRRTAEQREYYARKQPAHDTNAAVRSGTVTSDNLIAKGIEYSRPQDSAQLAVVMLQRARRSFGVALEESASKLRGSFFKNDMTFLYGALSAEIEHCLKSMADLGSKLRGEPLDLQTSDYRPSEREPCR
jgi:sRNA-binding protein